MSNYRSVNFYDMCRVCTSSSEPKLNIFSSEGKQKNLSSKIEECLPISIDEKDRFPKVLCSQCVQHLDSIIEFRNIAKNSQDMFADCLNNANLQTDGRVYLKENFPNGKNLNFVGNTNNTYVNLQQLQGLTFQTGASSLQSSQQCVQNNDIVNLIVQAVNAHQSENMQTDKSLTPQYTITVDNRGFKKTDTIEYKVDNPSTKSISPQKSNTSENDSKNALEEFIKMKPNIKLTPISKKDSKKSFQQPIAQQDQQQINQNLTQIQYPQFISQNQQQMQQQWQQQQQQNQFQQQIQQLTSQLQQQSQQITITAPTEMMSPNKSKKPKINFVLTSPTSQTLTTTLPQLAQQPQIQLHLQPTATQQQATLLSNLAPLLQQQVQSQSQTGNHQSSSGILSPNKCFLPITIKDENSDQQIVAHIDAKNFVLPTTYQLQMKLQPQLATVDGQPIVQLTPTSIPATIQLAPQSLANQQSFQTLQTGATLQQVYQQQKLQQNTTPISITSHQVLKPASNTINMTNSFSTNDAATSTNDQNDEFIIPDNINGKQEDSYNSKQPKYKITQQPGSNTIEITPTTNFTQQIMQQVQQQQQQKENQKAMLRQQKQMKPQVQQATSSVPTQHGGITVQRITNAKATIKSVQQQDLATKLPLLLNKQNVTISRITTNPQQSQTQNKQNNQIQEQPQMPKLQLRQKSSQKSMTIASGTTSSQNPKFSQQNSDLQAQQVANSSKTLPTKKPIRKITKGEKTLPQKTIQELPSEPSNTNAHPSASTTTADATNAESKLTPNNSIDSNRNASGLECSVCGRAFKKKEHLTQHAKLHAGLRPFKCTEEGCDKTFSRKEHLLRHQVSHSGKKMFSCDVCQKPFSRKDNLNKHRRIHTGQANSNNFTCEVCSKTFAVKAYYEQHKQMHEKEDTNQSNQTVKDSMPNSEIQQDKVVVSIQQPQMHQQLCTQHIQIIGQQQGAQQQQQEQQQQTQQQIMHLPTVVTTQDLAGNTITITKSGELNNGGLKGLGSHDATVLNLPSSLANFVHLGQAQFVNATTGQIMNHLKIEK